MGNNKVEETKPVENEDGAEKGVHATYDTKEAKAADQLRSALLKKKARGKKGSQPIDASLDVPEPVTLNTIRKAEDDRRAEEHRLKQLEPLLNSLSKYESQPSGPLYSRDFEFNILRAYKDQIKSDPELTQRVFNLIPKMDDYNASQSLVYFLEAGLTCPEAQVGMVKNFVERNIDKHIHVSDVEKIEKLVGFQGDFTPEQRNRMFASRFTVDHGFWGKRSARAQWDNRSSGYTLQFSDSHVPMFFPADRQIIEEVFEKLKGEFPQLQRNPLTFGADVRNYVEQNILPDVLNGDERIVELMLNARNLEEIKKVAKMSPERLTLMNSTRAGQERMRLVVEYRRAVARIDQDEESALIDLRSKFQEGALTSEEKRTAESRMKADFDLRRVEIEEEFNVNLRKTFEERDENVRGMVEGGLLEINKKWSGELRPQVKAGQQDAVKDRAFTLAIEKQNQAFFAVKEGETPDEAHERILGEIKKRIEDRFVGLQASRDKGSLEKSEEQQGRIGLGRLFEGLFQGENKQYLQEILSDKEYVKSLLFQYGDKKRKGGLPVPIESFQMDEHQWRPDALKELIDLHEKNFPGETHAMVARVVDGINQEVEAELFQIRKRNKIETGWPSGDEDDLNFGFPNVETGRYDRWLNFSQKFEIHVPFDQLPGVTPEEIAKINPSHELNRPDEVFSEEYLPLFQKTFGVERTKRLLMEILMPELIEDKNRRKENEHTQYSGGGEYLYSPKRIFRFAKSVGIDLRGALAMVEEMEERARVAKEEGQFTRRDPSTLQSGMFEAYHGELRAFLKASGM